MRVVGRALGVVMLVSTNLPKPLARGWRIRALLAAQFALVRRVLALTGVVPLRGVTASPVVALLTCSVQGVLCGAAGLSLV